MRVFITGAAGFIGSATTKELIANGHQVVGLGLFGRQCRSAAKNGCRGSSRLAGRSRQPQARREGNRGTIHCAFIHDFSKFAENGGRQACHRSDGRCAGGYEQALHRDVRNGARCTERDGDRKNAARGLPDRSRVSEQAGLLMSSGVRAMAIRLPQVHGGEGKAGLITYLLELARQKGSAAYVGEGNERWAAAHRLDVARLYRLVLVKGTPDAIYHAVGEEGVPMKQVIEVIGRALNVPVTSIKKEEAGDYYGPLAMFVGLDMPASSALTQQWLGWKPREIGLMADIGQPGYFG